MKSLIAIALLTVSMSSFALEMQAYKSTTTNNVTLSDSAVESAWASNTPACMKDGSRIIGVNKEFRSKGLGYRDCSKGDAATRKHKALGYEVTVIKLSELSDTMIRSVLGKK